MRLPTRRGRSLIQRLCSASAPVALAVSLLAGGTTAHARHATGTPFQGVAADHGRPHARADAAEPEPASFSEIGPATDLRLAQRDASDGSAADDAATRTTAGTARGGDLVIEAGWTREPPPGASVGAGYMAITNTGPRADTLIGGSVAFAERLELHEMAVVDGVMRMAPLADGLVVPPGETVTLRPGGDHVMFMGLTDPPVAGDAVEVTLRFAVAGDVEITLPVAPVGAQGPEAVGGDAGTGRGDE